MLASILNSDSAILMSIAIVRVFVVVRKSLVDFANLSEQIDLLKTRLGEHDEQLKSIYDAIENMLDEQIDLRKWENRERIGFRTRD